MRVAKILAGYGSASLVQGLGGFVAVPLLIGVLGKDGFARWALVEPLVAVAAATSLLGVHYAHLHDIVGGRMSLAQSIGAFAKLGALPAISLCALFGVAATLVIDSTNLVLDASLAATLFFLESLILLVQFQSRAKSEAFVFASTIWVRTSMSLSVLGLANWSNVRFSLTEYLIVVVVVSSAALLVGARKRVPDLRESWASAKTLPWPTMVGHVRYGLPIVVSSALAVVVSTGDRFVVNALLPGDQLPGYVAMAKLGGAMSFAMTPINLWWPVARHVHVSDSDGGSRFFRAALPVLLAYYLFGAACLWLAASHLFDLYAPGVGGFDALCLLLLVVAGVALGMSVPLNIGTLRPGHTHWQAVAVAVAAVVGIMGAIAMIPTFGYRGAALATLLAQTANLSMTYFASQRLHPVRFQSTSLALSSLTGATLLWLLWQCQTYFMLQVLLLALGAGVLSLAVRKELRALSRAP